MAADRVNVDKGRITLQQATLARTGTPPKGAELDVWLFVVDPGHLRLLSRAEADAIAKMDVTALEQIDALTLRTRQERERLLGLQMRFIKTEIAHEKRLRIPARVFDICEERFDDSHVWVSQTAVRLDIYTASYIQRVLALAPTILFPGSFDIEN